MTPIQSKKFQGEKCYNYQGNNSSVSIGAGNTNVQVNTPNIGAAVEDTNSKEVVTVNKDNVTPSKYMIKEIDKN